MNNKSLFLDKILESLSDLQWHSLDEIRTQISTSLPTCTEDKITKFFPMLEKQEFIRIDEERRMAKISPQGLKFLGLPKEK